MPLFPYLFWSARLRSFGAPECLICAKQTDGALCSSCMAAFAMLEAEKPVFRLDGAATGENADHAALVCRFLYSYEYDPVKKLLFYLKRYPDRLAVSFFAEKLIGLLPEALKSEKTLYVNIPRSHKGRSDYGFDQGALLVSETARLISRRISLSETGRKACVRYANFLARRPFGQVQKKLNAKQRFANQSGRFYRRPFLRRLPWTPAHIVIVDDVITTGASVLAAAKILHGAFPAADISALSLAAVCAGRKCYTEKESYRKEKEEKNACEKNA